VLTVIRALRPKQWVKNLLVLGAPIASGNFFDYMPSLSLALLAFIVASSMGYLINDWQDRGSDKLHTEKQMRPFASGALDFRYFLSLEVICSLVLFLILLNLPTSFRLTVLIYLLISLSYTFFVKSVPVLEMMWLSSGFLIRALAGTTIINESPTGWFVSSVFFGAVFMVATKRLAEFKGVDAMITRKVISSYSESFLKSITTMSLTVSIMTYCLWVFQVHPDSYFAQISILPFTFTIVMYLFSCDQGDAEVPEKLLFSNKSLLTGISLTICSLLVVFYS
jgi:decaprenyl-phosphate phosphoribosyltransferase